MEESTPRVTPSTLPERPGVRLFGRWTAARLAEPAVWASVNAALNAATNAALSTAVGRAPPAPASAVQWDLRELLSLDHTGAQLLWNAWGHQFPAVHLLPDQQAMFERVARFTLSGPAPAPLTLLQRISSVFWARLMGLGGLLFRLFDHIRDLVGLIGQLLLDLLQLARAPHKGPWRDISGHLYRIGATAMPITALVGFLIGVVLAYLMSQQLRQFGADAFIVDVLGISLIRELGPVLAAILLAGRSGSAITAQIGVMRVTEELDAMKVMGISQGYRLVMPRAIAMAIAMPLITVWTTVSALAGGMLAADVVLGVTPEFFAEALPAAVQASNLTLAVGKSVVFGLMIALIGCHYGLRIKPNTESLGEGTTASVVTSITVVILVDALFAVVFKDVGI